MGVKADHWISRMAQEHGMIEPFEESQISQGVVSYGLSSYGYDMRLASRFLVFRGGPGEVVDPKASRDDLFEPREEETCLLSAGSFVLGRSVEYFRIPRSVLAICSGKSTYARCGVVVNVTPFEPEWEGFVTLSIANTGSSTVKLYAGEGIAQVMFLGADEECDISYADRKGKYQAQDDIRRAKVSGARVHKR